MGTTPTTVYLLLQRTCQTEYTEPNYYSPADDATIVIGAYASEESAQRACAFMRKKIESDPWTYDDPDKEDPRGFEVIAMPVQR